MSTSKSTGSTGTFEEANASLFQSSRAEVVIDRPATQVWAFLTDLSLETLQQWNPGLKRVRHTSGEPRQENEVVMLIKDDRVMLTKDDEAPAQAPFYMRSVRMVPPYQRVLRIEAIDGSFNGFVDHTLFEANGKTTLVYSGYFETRRVPADQVKSFNYKQMATAMMDYLHETHGLLKQAIEKMAPAQ